MGLAAARLTIAGIILIIGLVGCSGTTPSDGPHRADPADSNLDAAPEARTDSAHDLSISGLLAVPNPGNVLSYFVVWTTDRPATTVVDVDCGDYVATLTDDGPRTDHEALVLGLYDGAACAIGARSVAADGAVAEAVIDVSVGPLPEALPPLTLEVAVADQVQPGWTAFNLSDTVGSGRPAIVVVDEIGRYRWYHIRDTASSASAMLVRRVPEGFLVGGGSDGGKTWPAIIDLEGRVRWDAQLEKEHHEILPWGDDALMYLSTTKDCPEEIGESATVVVHDRETSETSWSWSLCEHFTPANGKDDWDHTNAIDPFPGDGALLLSVRNLHQLFKVDMGSGAILWRLGIQGDFTRVDGGVGAAFLRQHAAELVDEDRVILFDNGKKGVRENSGAVEIVFDEATMEYGVAWSWYPEPPIFAKVWGDADRLDNGNTLIAYGRREELESHLIEVTMDGERVWELVGPPGWGWYRAERMPPLPAGHVVGGPSRADSGRDAPPTGKE